MEQAWLEWIKNASFRELMTSIGVREQLIIVAPNEANKNALMEERATLIAEAKSRPEYPDEFLRTQE